MKNVAGDGGGVDEDACENALTSMVAKLEDFKEEANSDEFCQISKKMIYLEKCLRILTKTPVSKFGNRRWGWWRWIGLLNFLLLFLGKGRNDPGNKHNILPRSRVL